jgi:hypothetical protein
LLRRSRPVAGAGRRPRRCPAHDETYSRLPEAVRIGQRSECSIGHKGDLLTICWQAALSREPRETLCLVGATGFEPVTLPCQQNPGNRGARSRSPRSAPAVDAQGKCSLDVQLNALFRTATLPLLHARRSTFHAHEQLCEAIHRLDRLYSGSGHREDAAMINGARLRSSPAEHRLRALGRWGTGSGSPECRPSWGEWRRGPLAVHAAARSRPVPAPRQSSD